MESSLESWKNGILEYWVLKKQFFNASPIIPPFHHPNVPSKLAHRCFKPSQPQGIADDCHGGKPHGCRCKNGIEKDAEEREENACGHGNENSVVSKGPE